jgi:hypothetical protein
MRSASSYRGAKKREARERGVKFQQFNEHFQRSRHYAAAELERKALNSTMEQAQEALDVTLGRAPMSPDKARAARKLLAQWAATGGRLAAIGPAATDEELQAINATSPRDHIAPEQEAAAVEAAKKITTEDVDKALEAALTNWQHKMHRLDPMPLSRLMAARARAIGWAEGVEFYEE